MTNETITAKSFLELSPAAQDEYLSRATLEQCEQLLVDLDFFEEIDRSRKRFKAMVVAS